MSDLNSYACTGRLTRDPELRYLANDKQVASIGLAIGHTYMKDGAKCEDTLFLDCEAWGKTAEIIGQYCAKGKQVAVSGRLKLDTWEDKSGGKRSKVKLIIDSLTLLGSKPESSGGDAQPRRDPPPRPTRPASDPAPSASEDDPPF